MERRNLFENVRNNQALYETYERPKKNYFRAGIITARTIMAIGATGTAISLYNSVIENDPDFLFLGLSSLIVASTGAIVEGFVRDFRRNRN